MCVCVCVCLIMSAYSIFDLLKPSYDFWMEWILESAMFPQELPAPTGAIIRGVNNEMTNTVISHVHLYKE